MSYYTDAKDDAEDMLVNAELRIGGLVGIGTSDGYQYAQGRGWLGPKGGLSAKGLVMARKLQREYWGDHS